MSVAEAQARVSSAELAEWMALASIEPFGERRRDWRAAMLASVVASVFSDAELSPEDFMPTWGEPERPKTPEQETRAVLEALGAVRKER